MCPVAIEVYSGPRADLLPLFRLADDSLGAILGYLEVGEVLVARRDGRIIGHVQSMAGEREWEIRSVAVIERERGEGVGRALIRAALGLAFGAGAERVLVATATADLGNLRFYQRLGFRMDRIERDAFRAENGYADLESDGIPIRDRVWFSICAGDTS